MPIYDKIEGYTLKGAFVAGGGIYTPEDGQKLALWVRFRSSPADESGNSLTVSYDGSPVINNQPIPSKAVNRIGDLPVAQFSDSANSNAKVAGAAQLIFNNSTADTPFTISTWVKRDDLNANNIFAQENVAGGARAIDFGIVGSGGDNTIQLRLRDASGNRKYVDAVANIPDGVWSHVAVSYGGRGDISEMNFYLNGKPAGQKEILFDDGGYTYNDTNSTRPHYIGADYAGANEFDGNISELCIWRKALTPSAIKAIYHSTAGRYTARTGTISLPNRVRLREVDSLTGSYPTYSRTTGVLGDKKGDGPFTFNDTTTQLFKGASDVIFPLVQTEANLKHADLDNLIASPNQNSDLKSFGTASNYLSTQGFRKHINYGMNLEPFNETRVFLKEKNSAFYRSGTSGNDYPGFGSPLRDKIAINIPIPNNSAEKILTRWSGGTYIRDCEQGLLSSSFATTGFYYYNFTKGQWEDKGQLGFAGFYSPAMFYRAGATGSIPPALNGVLMGTAYQKIDDTELSGITLGGGWYSKPQQFTMSDHMGVIIDSKADSENLNHGLTSSRDPYSLLTSSLGYHLLGGATITGQAPWHFRYHASGSQTLKMSKYLSREFLLEKAVIDIPVVVNRLRGDESRATSGSRFYDSCRDIDNYTFFLYKQRKSSGLRDSQADISGSQRELIASGCASFYNSNAFSGRVPEAIRNRGLPHGPAFSHDWGVDVGWTANSTPRMSAFSGTIRIEMQAAITNSQPMGGSRFPIKANAGVNSLPGGFNSVVVQDYWTGGVSGLTQSVQCTSGLATTIANTKNFTLTPNNSLASGLAPYAARPTSLSNITLGTPYRVPEDRSLVGFEGTPQYDNWVSKVESFPSIGASEYQGGITTQENSLGILGYTDCGIQGMPVLFGARSISRVSPYILDPEDELIIGIDAGVSMLPVSASGMTAFINKLVNAGTDLGFSSGTHVNPTFGCMSGSFMKLMKGEAHLTLFGSEIKEEKEKLLNTNQNLTSNAIHEAVGFDPIRDEFETFSRSDLSGSYLDRFVGGPLTYTQTEINESNYRYGKAWQQNYAVTGSGRRVICYFSKNWSGIPKPGSSGYLQQHLHVTPFDNNRTGFPPTNDYLPAAGLGLGENQYITKDPYGLSPFKVDVLRSSFINSLQRFTVLTDNTAIYYDSMSPDISNLTRRSRALTFVSHPSASYSTPFIYANNNPAGSPHIDWVYRTDPPRFVNQRFWLRQKAAVHFGPGNSYWDFDPKFTKINKTLIFNRGVNLDQGEGGKVSTDLRRFRHKVTGAFGPTYGMISPVTQRPTARFRASSYGQFRDMLEQRVDTKYYDGLNSWQFGLTPGARDSPIQVTFVSDNDGITIVDPYSTDSSNFSSEYTSSYPYSEGRDAALVMRIVSTMTAYVST
jgi:hypothetical protein